MRPSSLALPLLALAALGLVAAPLALANGDGSEDAADAGKSKAAEKRAKGDAARAAHAPAQAQARGADAADAADENGRRPAHVAAFVDRMRELRGAWHENASKVREDCRAAVAQDENATGNETRAYAHCIRDGYRELRTWWKAEFFAAREDLKAAHEAWKAEKQAAAKARADDAADADA